jgi:type I restriction enzyme S subunit
MTLPKHWRLGSVAELIEGIDSGKNLRCEERPPTSKEVGIVKISAVTWGTFDATKSKTVVSDTQLPDSTRIRAGDLLMSRANTLELVGATVLVEEAPTNLHLSDKVLRLRAKPGWEKWLNIFLNSVDGRSEIESRATGNQLSMRNIGQDAIRNIALPIPPLAEQRRIVARIEALFARTRRARTDLERIAPLASRYIEQRRKRAFDEDSSWGLTGDTPPLPAYTPPAHFDELRTIPTGWQWAEVATISDIGGGLTKNQTRANNPIEIPYLRVANVYADELRLDSIETIRVSPGERDRIGLLPGDLLVVEGNGSVDQIGRVAIWDGSIPNCGHQNHLIRVRPRDGIPSRFILHWLMSPYGRSVLETVASSSSGLHTLSLSKVAAIPIPIPPTETAEKVATVLDQAAIQSAHAQREAVRALALLDRIEQSILARAFRGELVPHSLADDLQLPAQAVDPIVTVSPRRGRRAAA